MKIEGVLPHGGPLALDGMVSRPTAPASLTHAETWNDARPAHPENASRGRLPLRGTLSVLHHRALQNLSVTRANLSPPGVASTDSQLATALEKDFGRLHPFLNEGRLTWSSLRRVAAERTGQHEELDRTIQVVSEILKRPRLNDAILSRDGDITRDSLRAAAQTLQGNSSPSVFSQDPFHAQSNTQVVQALQGHFEQLRDKSQDRTFLFEQHQYVEIATLKAVMQDPYAVDPQGIPVLDPSTGMPRPKYSELCVYTAKNILERPGLLPSLERANGTRLFGPPQKEGWLSNKSLDRWLEQDEARKAR
ncbi:MULTISPECIES: type III secretion protein [Pseudomonas]|uniref:Type III secretion protein n=1 Tax=Pseudomonas sivasensis TaxID=1880678 RepID=A0ABW8E8R3_9PSED|nr:MULTISPECIES: type III secretion protein [Pseudomonas]